MAYMQRVDKAYLDGEMIPEHMSWRVFFDGKSSSGIAVIGDRHYSGITAYFFTEPDGASGYKKVLHIKTYDFPVFNDLGRISAGLSQAGIYFEPQGTHKTNPFDEHKDSK